MKQIFTLLALPLVALTSACTTQGAHGNDHWSQRSISNSMGRAFIGYDQSRDGDYLDFQAQNKKDVSTLVRRYFFHHNPENPFQVYDASYFAPRYPNSIAPDLVSYVQEPISSVIGTFSEGGADEFGEGFQVVGDGLAGKPSKYRTASYLRPSIGIIGADVDVSSTK
ncbi:MAG: hypothetical protein NTY35_10965 [Planctomycetota bacterium]|nr:hypothetical protein [Planctomycetota bacterium]